MKRKKRYKKEQIPQKIPVKCYIIGLIACVPFLLFGAAMIWVSVTAVSYTSPCTAETTGTIGEVSVKSEYKRDSKGRRYSMYTYTAQYTYYLSGKSVSDTLVTSKRIKEGQTIRIRYVPDDPGHKYVRGYDDAGNLIPLIFGIVWDGIFLIIIYAIIVSLKRRISENKH